MANYVMDYTYVDNRYALVIYDSVKQSFSLWHRPIQTHFPYCLVHFYEGMKREEIPIDSNCKDFDGAYVTTLYHPIWGKEANFMKVFFKSPHHILKYLGGEEFFENKIKYYTRYSIDEKVPFGMPYDVGVEKLTPKTYGFTEEETNLASDLITKEGFDKDMVYDVLQLLLTPVPLIPYVGIDIEVLSRGSVVPSPALAAEPITSIALVFNDLTDNPPPGKVLVLHPNVREVGYKPNANVIRAVRDKEYEVEFFDNEHALIKRFLLLIEDPRYKLLVTFNGDGFDLQYIHYRSMQLGIRSTFKHRKYMVSDRAYHTVTHNPYDDRREPEMNKKKLHLDLYKFFSHTYVKNYAFKNKYSDNRLDTISKGLVGMGKAEHDEKIDELSVHDLIHYNWVDTKLLDMLMRYQGFIVLQLIFMMMRLGTEPFGECIGRRISSKVQNFILYFTSQRNWVTPRRKDMKKKDTAAFNRLHRKVDWKSKYKGAIVIDPIPGAYFGVKCEDFTGLYTNIICNKNLSFETMNCKHKECYRNVVPEVGHHVCMKEKGLMAEVVGLVTTARGLYFKPKSKEDSRYTPIEQALKVFGNAMYGVFGAKFFPYYLRSQAESNTAWARHALMELIKEAIRLGMTVVAGDTDSVFLYNTTEESLLALTKFVDEKLGLELNLDYDLRFFTVSKRKKNYLGIKIDGEPVITGFKIKKRNTPPIIVRAGNEVISVIADMKDENDLRIARTKIILILRNYYNMIWGKEGDIGDYAFTTQVTMPIKKYKVIGPHVRAALMEAKHKLKGLPEGIGGAPEDIIPPGTYQPYVKTPKVRHRTPSGSITHRIGVMPLVLAKKKYISPGDYHKELISSMSQVVEMLNISPEDYITRNPIRRLLKEYV